jgi:hypothetical protein
VKKGLLLVLPLVLICPLLLLLLGLGNANIEAVRACATTLDSSNPSWTFGIGTLNWRGASHYETNPHPGERPYAERVPNMVTKIGSSGSSIIGFQEFEPEQAQAFLDATDGAWAIVKGKNAKGNPSTVNAIAYQPAAWEVVEVRYVSIKYGRPLVQMPMARFSSTSGLGSIWVLNVHNPADAVGGTDAMRDAAVTAEAQALQQLQANEPNTPLFLTGDMNDKARFERMFLSLASGWSSANPSDGQIDWIMGSPAVTFSGAVVDQSTNDGAHKYTDHPFVHTIAQLAGASTNLTGGGTELGAMPTAVKASPGGSVSGEVLVANANIKTRDGFDPGVRALVEPSPDFITLNEIGDVPLAQMRSAAPGYDAYREEAVDETPGGGEQSLNNAIMWRTDTWTLLDGGRVKIVDDDHVVTRVGNRLWDRYAVWGVFQRVDGAVVSVIAVHHMTNAYRYPRQWGEPPMTRAEQYGLGMDHLIELIGVLAPYGPVMVGGDMNSHPQDGPHAAAPRMEAAGYRYTKDSGVIYNFYTGPVKVAATWEISEAAVHSDHPALFTRMAMSGAGPRSGLPGTMSVATGPVGCPRCPTSVAAAALPAVTLTEVPAEANVAASAAYAAGFRGEDLVTAVAIARVESAWNPEATNESHFGLWQIAREHKGKVPGWNTRADILDPLLNARYAFALYSARPGSGDAKFADWIPFEETDYHQYLDVARQAVAATAGGVTTVAEPGCTTSPITVAGELSAALKARLEAMMKTPNGLCSLSWTRGAPCTYDNQCPKVVDALYGGSGLGRGYGDGQDVAQGIINAGLAQSHGTGLDPLPPVGAVVSYNTGNGVGHVAIYVGGGKIFGNDYGCAANGVYGCVGFADVATPGGFVTWALPKQAFDLGGMPTAAA